MKRFKFEETKLGFFLKYEVPVVYDILLEMSPPGRFFQPPYLLIKLVCEGSPDPSLRKDKFRRYLEEYAKDGLYCKRPKVMTPEREVYYERIRGNKLRDYIRENKGRIEGFIGGG